MANIPATSTTLLRNIAQDAQHTRWTGFVVRYRPMMEAYLRGRMCDGSFLKNQERMQIDGENLYLLYLVHSWLKRNSELVLSVVRIQ